MSPVRYGFRKDPTPAELIALRGARSPLISIPSSADQASIATLYLVDDPASEHGQAMAQLLPADVHVEWLVPTLSILEVLRSIRGPGAVAVPLRVRGGHPDDPYTRAFQQVIRELMGRGIPVVVAQGIHPNPLAAAGIPARREELPGSSSASESCVRIAVRRLQQSRAGVTTQADKVEARHG